MRNGVKIIDYYTAEDLLYVCVTFRKYGIMRIKHEQTNELTYVYSHTRTA